MILIRIMVLMILREGVGTLNQLFWLGYHRSKVLRNMVAQKEQGSGKGWERQHIEVSWPLFN